MRILHVNNIAGVPQVIVDEQRRRGHTVDLVNYSVPPYGFRTETIIPSWDILGRLGLIARRYAVYHLHSSSLLPRYFDAPLTAILRKRVIYHHHGSDIRYKKEILSRCHPSHLISTPELGDYCSSRPIWVPNPLNLKEWQYEPFKNSVRKKKPVVFMPHKEKNLPFTVLKNRLASCDVVYEEKTIGGSGTRAYTYLMTQAMALGKIVVTPHFDKTLYPQDCPVLTAMPKREDIERLSEASRRYVEKYHDVRNVVNRLEVIYTR